MKRQTFTWTALVFGLGITLASCSYKAECTCTFGGVEATVHIDEDNKDDYNEAKQDCIDSGCDWKAKL